MILKSNVAKNNMLINIPNDVTAIKLWVQFLYMVY